MKNSNGYKVETVTFRELANRLGIQDLNDPEVYDMTDDGYEILSRDTSTGKNIWSPMEAFVVKQNAADHYQLDDLHGTKDHRVLLDGEYVKLSEHPAAVFVKQPIQVVDCQVGSTHNYIAEGQINHNTTTPGGMAIPYHASVRIKLTGGQQIKKTLNGEEAIIGISVTAKTIKNKVARPWRSVDFEIHFGKGIREEEQLFDALRVFCEKTSKPAVLNGKKVVIEGTGSWKNFTVSDVVTGVIDHDVKFYKTEFRQKVLSVVEYEPYIMALCDACFIMHSEDLENITASKVDPQSVEEMEAYTIQTRGDGVTPD